MTIRQYRPAFFEGFENETVEFSDVAELEAIPFVRNHMVLPDFHRLSITHDNTLMAETDGGERWFVVGTITGGRPDLPLAVFEKPHETMSEDPTPYNGTPIIELPPPAAPDPDEAPPLVLLDDAYFDALIGHSVSATEPPRAVYSLSKLVSIERRTLNMPFDTAQLSILKTMETLTAEHGANAPIFMDDAISQPKGVKPAGRIIRPPGGFRPRHRN